MLISGYFSDSKFKSIFYIWKTKKLILSDIYTQFRVDKSDFVRHINKLPASVEDQPDHQQTTKKRQTISL